MTCPSAVRTHNAGATSPRSAPCTQNGCIESFNGKFHVVVARVIRQKLWASLGEVAMLIPATIFGLSIGTAVLFHEGSTLLVVVNALRLLAFGESSAVRT